MTQSDRIFKQIDHDTRWMIGQLSGSVAPSAYWLAGLDWAMHLASAPGRQAQLAGTAMSEALRLATGRCCTGAEARAASDHRFQDAAWSKPPFRCIRDGFWSVEDWWHMATHDVRGLSPRHAATVDFTARQWLDMLCPANVPWLNPALMRRTMETGGANLMQGAMNLADDLRPGSDIPEDPALQVGKGLATTPGQVVARTHLAELIQYTPTTEKTHPQPILIVPAWIMKYYILDLSAHNSMVKWLVDQGFTVFMLSWRNPTREDHDLSMADYVAQGPMAALDQITRITGAQKVHLAGYCLGGTLATIAAADMARRGDDRLASLSLFAAQVDFSEAGEVTQFISEAQVSLLEDVMAERGYLDSSQMSGAFTTLRARDLLWSRIVHEYLMGEPRHSNDLMVWNDDGTRMPARMHSEYLRQLFLENQLSNGKYELAGRRVALSDLRLPICAVGTETDHVAPWKSVFKIQRLTETQTTFILTSGGHNAGIVSEPGHPHRHFRIATTARDAPFQDADDWMAANSAQDGSWWPAWGDWLAARSDAPAPAPAMGDALCPAPGTYVMQR